MPTRAQRRVNREARQATFEHEAYVANFPGVAEEKLGIRRDFVREALRTSGLISLSFRPGGTANYLEVYGGIVTTDGNSKLKGDTIVNNWELPEIKGFKVRFDKDSALVARLSPQFTAIDVTNVWLRTSDELLDPRLSMAEEGKEEHIVMTREGLYVLTRTIGHSAVRESLNYIHDQVFSHDQAAA